jgi:hypothetical protein
VWNQSFTVPLNVSSAKFFKDMGINFSVIEESGEVYGETGLIGIAELCSNKGHEFKLRSQGAIKGQLSISTQFVPDAKLPKVIDDYG